MLFKISTAVIVLFLIASAAAYLFHQTTIEGVLDLGFPDYFRVQLAVMKFVAAVVLAVPLFPPFTKEWAYVGVAIFLITAMVAHYAHGDPIALNLVNVGLFALLVTSYIHRP